VNTPATSLRKEKYDRSQPFTLLTRICNRAVLLAESVIVRTLPEYSFVNRSQGILVHPPPTWRYKYQESLFRSDKTRNQLDRVQQELQTQGAV
jgi:hypothetical protein